jgi:hypothetical protein
VRETVELASVVDQLLELIAPMGDRLDRAVEALFQLLEDVEEG